MSCPPWGITLDKVSVARDSASSRSISTASNIRRFTSLPREDITTIAGFKVTGIERTLLDVSLTCGFAAAVVAIERALHQRLVSKHVLVEYYGSKRNLNNLPEGLKALAFASMLSESVLESRSRLFFDHFAIPIPEQQVTITARSGRRYRVDFLWRDIKLIGEADGKRKILEGAENEQSARLGKHWQREEDLRAEGYTFVRWGWDDLARPNELRARIGTAFLQAQRFAA